MGVSCMSSCSGGSYCKTATPSTPPLSPNPNPYRYTIKKRIEIEQYTILVVTYDDCTNFEGEKILVYDVSLGALGKMDGFKKLDPHFSDDEISPIARFKPDKQGLKNAKLFVKALASNEDVKKN